ncbi:hypothetical protein LB503_004902 [Fusarium chuoi]|nr:hypothetical protein LB503_004902 [Fusarium chuoi]
MSLIEVSAEAPLIDCGDESIDQSQVLLHDVEESREEEILLPEIVNLHHDLGCLLADAHGEYRYMGAESGASFNSAVRSWMLRMGAGTRSKEKDKDKIPGMLKVHCLYWIYSAESFYTRLETTYSGDNGQMTASWLCSLHGIVALCASCEPSPNGLVNGQRAHDSLEMAKSLVTRSNGFTNSAYLHIGLAVRIAFSLGLHLDKYSTKSGVVSQAHARRLWWTLYLVDQDLSLALGKPSMNSPPNETSWKPPLPSEFPRFTYAKRIPRAVYTSRSNNTGYPAEPLRWTCPWRAKAIEESLQRFHKCITRLARSRTGSPSLITLRVIVLQTVHISSTSSLLEYNDAGHQTFPSVQSATRHRAC